MYKKIPTVDPTIRQEKAQLGMRFGFIAGLAFIFAAWLPDALELMNAHAMMPWAKMILGALPVLVIFTFIGWYTARMDKALLNILLWILTSAAAGWFGGHLPYEGLTWMLRLFSPETASRVSYPFHEGMAARVTIVILICAGVGLIGGTLEGMLLDNAYSGRSPFARTLPLLIWVVVFVTGASMLDNMIQQPLRGPVTAINDLINFRLQNEQQPVSKEVARAMHLAALDPIRQKLHQPRQLILSEYDDIMVMTRILIHFEDGSWARCTVMADQSSQPYTQQPSYCEEWNG